MKVIDLSQDIYDAMPVFPGDPEAKVSLVYTIEKDEWNMTRMEINAHDGTHVNVPSHSSIKGKTLDEYKIADFTGESYVYSPKESIKPNKGIIFVDHDIDMDIAKKIVAAKPKFIGLSSRFEFDLIVEKYLLGENIISFERLENADLLPTDRSFMFYGVPLKIRAGDGSPVRAFAIVD